MASILSRPQCVKPYDNWYNDHGHSRIFVIWTYAIDQNTPLAIMNRSWDADYYLFRIQIDFPWLCAWDACYIIFCHLLHIHSWKTENLFSLLLCSLWWVQIVGYVLACRSYSFVCTLHHLIIIIVQTYGIDWILYTPTSRTSQNTRVDVLSETVSFQNNRPSTKSCYQLPQIMFLEWILVLWPFA